MENPTGEPGRRVDLKLANESWESLLRAHAAMMRGFAGEQMWKDLSLHEYDVLYTLTKAGCALRLSDLNQAVLLSQPALSRLVERMVARGLLARDRDPHDRRGIQITLTPAGAEAQRRTGLRHARSVGRRMAALTADQQHTLFDLCQRLGEAQQDDPHEEGF